MFRGIAVPISPSRPQLVRLRTLARTPGLDAPPPRSLRVRSSCSAAARWQKDEAWPQRQQASVTRQHRWKLPGFEARARREWLHCTASIDCSTSAPVCKDDDQRLQWPSATNLATTQRSPAREKDVGAPRRRGGPRRARTARNSAKQPRGRARRGSGRGIVLKWEPRGLCCGAF